MRVVTGLPVLVLAAVVAVSSCAMAVAEEPGGGVAPEAPRTPQIANRPLVIAAVVEGEQLDGVIVAQGGVAQGVALVFRGGRPVFELRRNGELRSLSVDVPDSGRLSLTATLTPREMTLVATPDDASKRSEARHTPGPGESLLLSKQPLDELSVGFDAKSAVGRYRSPHRFTGTIVSYEMTVGDPIGSSGKTGDLAAPGKMLTRWGREVTAENTWTESPRPLLRREDWTNLNGRWQYAITPRSQRDVPSEWMGEILVPFCLESQLGGVQRLLEPTECLWYRRTFDLAESSQPTTRLNFEAVDYSCEVFLNGQPVGSHTGGNVPFSFDVSAAVRTGANELLVRVEDATEGYQLRGKQKLEPKGIWYTRVSGIWQTVWLERLPATHLADVKIATDAAAGSITVTPIVRTAASEPGTAGPPPAATVSVVVREGDRLLAEATTRGGQPVTITIPRAKLWSPSSPFLYDLEITVGEGASATDETATTADRVRSYAGIRSVGKRRDADGHWRYTLNGEPIFHWGPLDQGWWPDGLLTPPSDEAMVWELEWLKAAGFNMVRKHIKVEPRRYYAHCDRLGLMVWQDHVSGGEGEGRGWPKWTRLQPAPSDAEWPDEAHEQFLGELAEMIDTLESHPSIVSWVPFNERWGQHRTREVGEWTVARDPGRIVNVASGGNFWPVGDVIDHHQYPHPGFPFELNEASDGTPRFDAFIKVVGEFGGHGYPVPGHLWDESKRNWGYGGLPKDKQEWRQRYKTSLRKLAELKAAGIAAGVYTQTSDVEGEINGLMTYDREVIKLPAEELAELFETIVGARSPATSSSTEPTP